MAAKVTFFPVGNGDMTLITLADVEGTTLLIDLHIRAAADDSEDDTRDVAKDLRERLKKDDKGRPYVDAFLLSHPDKDHCTGLATHFHLGALADYPDDKKAYADKKIVIREIWSSPLVYRRGSKTHTLTEDAKAFNAEAKRRVQVNRDKGFKGVEAGDRILVMGEDENGKTDDLGPILIKVDQEFTRINGQATDFLTARLLAPFPKQDDAAEEDLLSKNNSSVVLNLQIAASKSEKDGCKFLTAGDAEVAIWERLWARNKGKSAVLEYDLLQAPHHCSWHSLSYDSWSKKREKGEVSADARSALSQARSGAFIVASSGEIKDDDCDPPCIGAKREYQKILNKETVKGQFLCTGEYPSSKSPEPLEFSVTGEGPQKPQDKETSKKVASIITPTRTPQPHG
jgi:beta-lactamase superfamily II metal-dependent hydrolase